MLATGREVFVLHPSLMDGALQAAICLLVDLATPPKRPPVPFLLSSLRVLSPCTSEMSAWVRYAENDHADAHTIAIDLDLCDVEGNICVQMRRLAARTLETAIEATQQPMVQDSTLQEAPLVEENDARFDDEFYRTLIADVAGRRLSVDEAAERG
jgi:hypothetical protein